MSPRESNVARGAAEGNIAFEGWHFDLSPDTTGTIFYIVPKVSVLSKLIERHVVWYWKCPFHITINATNFWRRPRRECGRKWKLVPTNQIMYVQIHTNERAESESTPKGPSPTAYFTRYVSSHLTIVTRTEESPASSAMTQVFSRDQAALRRGNVTKKFESSKKMADHFWSNRVALRPEIFSGPTYRPEVFSGPTYGNVARSRDCPRPIRSCESHLRYDIYKIWTFPEGDMEISGPKKSDIARGAAEGDITFLRARNLHIARGKGPYFIYYTSPPYSHIPLAKTMTDVQVEILAQKF